VKKDEEGEECRGSIYITTPVFCPAIRAMEARSAPASTIRSSDKIYRILILFFSVFLHADLDHRFSDSTPASKKDEEKQTHGLYHSGFSILNLQHT
jgi:hypothetical protein